jgi:Tfp pilus assembly protein PilP
VYKIKRKHIGTFWMYGMAIIIIIGIPPAQAKEKVTLKIPKEKNKVTKPSKKPAEPIKKHVEKKNVSGDIAPKTKDTYSYDPINKIDPFKSFITVRRELEEKEPKKPKTYLETLDISQLVISAIILGSQGNWALVRDSKGDGHVIKVGTPIGKRNGQVTKILEEKVIITESYQDLSGRKKTKTISMELPSTDADIK